MAFRSTHWVGLTVCLVGLSLLGGVSAEPANYWHGLVEQPTPENVLSAAESFLVNHAGDVGAYGTPHHHSTYIEKLQDGGFMWEIRFIDDHDESFVVEMTEDLGLNEIEHHLHKWKGEESGVEHMPAEIVEAVKNAGHSMHGCFMGHGYHFDSDGVMDKSHWDFIECQHAPPDMSLFDIEVSADMPHTVTVLHSHAHLHQVPDYYFHGLATHPCPDAVIAAGEQHLTDHASEVGAVGPYHYLNCLIDKDEEHYHFRWETRFEDANHNEYEIDLHPSGLAMADIEKGVSLEDMPEYAVEAASKFVDVHKCENLEKAIKGVWEFDDCHDAPSPSGMMDIHVEIDAPHEVTTELSDSSSPHAYPEVDNHGLMHSVVPGEVISHAMMELEYMHVEVGAHGPYQYIETHVHPHTDGKPWHFDWDVRFEDEHHHHWSVYLSRTGLTLVEIHEVTGEELFNEHKVECGEIKGHYKAQQCCGNPNKMVEML